MGELGKTLRLDVMKGFTGLFPLSVVCLKGTQNRTGLVDLVWYSKNGSKLKGWTFSVPGKVYYHNECHCPSRSPNSTNRTAVFRFRISLRLPYSKVECKFVPGPSF